MSKRIPWSRAENVAVVILYMSMRASVDAGEKYSKAGMIRSAQADALANRSRGSIEAKLMNMTACLIDLGLAHRSLAEHGYKPAPNYQKDLRTLCADLYMRDAA